MIWTEIICFAHMGEALLSWINPDLISKTGKTCTENATATCKRRHVKCFCPPCRYNSKSKSLCWTDTRAQGHSQHTNWRIPQNQHRNRFQGKIVLTFSGSYILWITRRNHFGILSSWSWWLKWQFRAVHFIQRTWTIFEHLFAHRYWTRMQTIRLLLLEKEQRFLLAWKPT